VIGYAWLPFRQPKTNAEKKEMELIGMYETQRSQLIHEIQILRSEIQPASDGISKELHNSLVKEHKQLISELQQLKKEKEQLEEELALSKEDYEYLLKQQITLRKELERRAANDQQQMTQETKPQDQFREIIVDTCRILELQDRKL
jgi:seryl-tRNA synthetase